MSDLNRVSRSLAVAFGGRRRALTTSLKSAVGIMLVAGLSSRNKLVPFAKRARSSPQHHGAMDEEEKDVTIDEGEKDVTDDGGIASDGKSLPPLQSIAEIGVSEEIDELEQVGKAESQDCHDIIMSKSSLSNATRCSVATEYKIGTVEEEIEEMVYIENLELKLQEYTPEKSPGEVGVEVLSAMLTEYDCSFLAVWAQNQDEKEADDTSYDRVLMDHPECSKIIVSTIDGTTPSDEYRSVPSEANDANSTQMVSNVEHDPYSKARHAQRLVREAMLNTECEARTAELKLSRLKLESEEIDKELNESIMGDIEENMSEDSLFDLMEALFTVHRYIKGSPVNDQENIPSVASASCTEGTSSTESYSTNSEESDTSL